LRLFVIKISDLSIKTFRAKVADSKAKGTELPLPPPPVYSYKPEAAGFTVKLRRVTTAPVVNRQ
jgi:hypothetical protein